MAAAHPPVIRIVVVDSQPVLLRGLRDVINARRPLMEVVGISASYREALALVERLRPELVLLSLFTDPLDGIEVIQALCRRWDVRVALLVRQGTDGTTDRARVAGIRQVVDTQEPTEVLLDRIVQAAGRAQEPAAAWPGNLGQLPIRTQPPQAPAGREPGSLSVLTPRERDVVQALIANPSAKYMTIGAHLGVSEHTVHNHLTSIYQKLHVTNRIELLVYAMRHQGDGTILRPKDDAPGIQ